MTIIVSTQRNEVFLVHLLDSYCMGAFATRNLHFQHSKEKSTAALNQPWDAGGLTHDLTRYLCLDIDPEMGQTDTIK